MQSSNLNLNIQNGGGELTCGSELHFLKVAFSSEQDNIICAKQNLGRCPKNHFFSTFCFSHPGHDLLLPAWPSLFQHAALFFPTLHCTAEHPPPIYPHLGRRRSSYPRDISLHHLQPIPIIINSTNVDWGKSCKTWVEGGAPLMDKFRHSGVAWTPG